VLTVTMTSLRTWTRRKLYSQKSKEICKLLFSFPLLYLFRKRRQHVDGEDDGELEALDVKMAQVSGTGPSGS